MRKVLQTEFGPKSGNCFSAVIASLLEMPLEDVPNFCEGARPGASKWWDQFQAWLTMKGYSAIELVLSPLEWAPNEGQECWLVGSSPRGDCDHAVCATYVAGKYKMTHDPHPDGEGLKGDPRDVGFLIPLALPTVNMTKHDAEELTRHPNEL
jgi:hypothetical protein